MSFKDSSINSIRIEESKYENPKSRDSVYRIAMDNLKDDLEPICTSFKASPKFKKF